MFLRAVVIPLLFALLPGCGEPTAEQQPKKKNIEMVAFSAKWCNVCGDVPPLFDELKKKFPNVTFRVLDVDEPENMELYVKAMPKDEDPGLPFFFVYADGQIVDHQRGLLPTDHMARFLNAAIAK